MVQECCCACCSPVADCTKCLTRNIVWWMNLVFLLAGLGIIGCAVYALVQADMVVWAGGELAYGTIALGGFIVILAICALCGAQKRVKKCWMWIYAVFMTLLVLGQIAIVALVLTQLWSAEDFLEDRWEDNLTQEQRDELMKQLKCGVHNPDDPEECGPISGELKEAMCSVESNSKPARICSTKDICFNDCYNVISLEFASNARVLAIVGIAVAAVELTLLVSSCCLLCVEEEEEKGFYGAGDFSV